MSTEKKVAATREEIDDMIDKIKLGLEQVDQLIKVDSFHPSNKNYELKYFTRITMEAFRMLQTMSSTSEFDW